MVSKKTETVFELQNAILKTVAELVESRDNITGGHIERTQEYLALFIDFLLNHDIYTNELAEWDINLFIMSSQLHDVGKISIKDDILMKPGKLTHAENEEMKEHTIHGIKILEKIEGSTPESAFLKHAKILAGSHHEKWDGTGYPFGLKGTEIPLQGRLMAVVDVYDALTNDRPYKKAYTHEESVEIIRNGSGVQFDPALTDVFLEHEKEFKRVMNNSMIIAAQREHNNISGKSESHTVAAIMDAQTSVKDGQDKIRRYLAILISALLKHERYRKEVLLYEKEDLNEGLLLRHAQTLTGTRHERWDGNGDPSEIKGSAIPLQERLIAIVDVYHALTTDSPDKKRMSHQAAVNVIRSYRGTYFDPIIVNIFLDHEKEFMGVESFL